MNFEDIIKAHSQWKIRLQGTIQGITREEFDLQAVGSDRLCVLGEWMNQEGRIYARFPEFGELQREHAGFHRRAADVLRTFQRGDSAGAKAMLEPGGCFHEASMSTINAIRHLRDKVRSAEGRQLAEKAGMGAQIG